MNYSHEVFEGGIAVSFKTGKSSVFDTWRPSSMFLDEGFSTRSFKRKLPGGALYIGRRPHLGYTLIIDCYPASQVTH